MIRGGLLLGISMGVSMGVLSGNIEPPLPEWNDMERQAMLREGWLAGGLLLTDDPLPEEEKAEATPLEVEEPTKEEIGEVVQDGALLGDQLVGKYFESRPVGHIVDPQALLKPKEAQDLEAFLGYHAGDSSIDMYVYVFGADQQIPSDVREEEVVERHYSVGKPAIIVYYYLGAPQRSEIYLSPVLTDAVSAAEQARALSSSVVQAFSDVDAAGQLQAFLVQMSIRIYWMERMIGGTAAETMESIPMGDRREAAPQDGGGAVLGFELPSWFGFVSDVAAAILGVVVLVWVGWSWMKSRVSYRFPEFDVEARLGGSHAAGIGAVISFSSTAVSPARQRDQVPDYMRRA